VREAKLHGSGRISVAQASAELANHAYLQTRDQIISYLETEEKQYKELAEKGWDSDLGKSLRMGGKYKGPGKNKDEAMKFYVQENNFRKERRDYFTSCLRQGVRDGELELCMNEWDRTKRQQAALPAASRVEQTALATKVGATSQSTASSPSLQPTVEDEDEDDSADTEPPGHANTDHVIEQVQDHLGKLQNIKRQTGSIYVPPPPPLPPLPPTYDPYEKLSSTVETFMLNEQVAAHEAAKSSPPPTSKPYEPDHMNQWNFPKNLVSALSSEEFENEDMVMSCLANLAKKTSMENEELRKKNIKLKHDKINREAQREKDQFAQKCFDILNKPEPPRLEVGEKFDSLLAEIPKLVAGPKPITDIQLMKTRGNVIGVTKKLYWFLKDCEEEKDEINALREHMNGKPVCITLLDTFSGDNMEWLRPMLTEKLINNINELLDQAKKVDAHIIGLQQTLTDQANSIKARANINKPVEEFQERIGAILTVVYDELMEILNDRMKLERIRLDMAGKNGTVTDRIQEEFRYATSGTIYHKIKNEKLETAWKTIVQAAEEVDENLKQIPQKKVAKEVDLPPLLYGILNQLRTPLLTLLPREADMPDYQKPEEEPDPQKVEKEPVSQKAEKKPVSKQVLEKGPYKSAIIRLFQAFENLPEKYQSEILEMADRDVLIEELWNDPEIWQNLEEAAPLNKGKGKAVEKYAHPMKNIHVKAMHAYASSLLHAPLAEKVFAKELQEQVKYEVYLQFGAPQYQEQIPQAAWKELEGDSEDDTQESQEEHDLDVQQAIQESLETEKTRKIKKPTSVSEGLRKKMAKAKVDKRLSEVAAGGATSSGIGLKEGIKVWNEEHGLENTNVAEKRMTVEKRSTIHPDQDLIEFAVMWYNNREKNGSKLPGHSGCKCSAAEHAELKQTLINIAETAEKLTNVVVGKNAAQIELAGLETAEEVAEMITPAPSFVSRKSKSKAKKKTPKKSNQNTVGEASSSTSQGAGSIADTLSSDEYDATPTQYTDAISIQEGTFLDMET
jgi:hypothetical protein